MESAVRAEAGSAPANPVERFFGPVLRWFARRYYEAVRFPPEGEKVLETASHDGHVVHVMQASGYLNFLYLMWALLRRNLPPLRAALGVTRWWFRPFRRLLSGAWSEQQVATAFDKGGSVLVFLRAPYVGTGKGRALTDPFPALVALQRKTAKPIFVIPELLIWEQRPAHLVPTVWDALFGSPEARGKIVGLISFLRNYRRAFVRIGQPIDLKRFVEEQAGEPDAIIARKIRGSLHQHLARESRASLGPPLKPADRVIEEILRDRTLRANLEHAARELNRPYDDVLVETKKHLQEIAARYNPRVVRALLPVMRWVFNRIYDGIVVDQPGLARALAAAHTAPVVFCPSHKSHIDYLIMIYALFDHGMPCPHVAAGANLAFWPFGPLARRGGAFFLRRSFKGDLVYSAAFRAYIKKLIRDGHPQEFFPEGGRSRTGKLLPPKMGMFTMQIEAVADGARDDICYVPVAIDYERIVEAQSYAHELSGGEKKAESARDLLSTPRVLRARYGRIYISFDEPISLRSFLAARGQAVSDLEGEAKRAAVRALAARVMYGITRVQTITPSALVASSLLSHRRRGLAASELRERIEFLRGLAARDEAKLSPPLQSAPSDPLIPGPIQEALRLMESDGSVHAETAGGETIYAVRDEARPNLVFYKNNLLPLVTQRSLVAAALLCNTAEATVLAVAERVRTLSRLLKFELNFRVGAASFLATFEETLLDLVQLGVIEKDGDHLRPPPAAAGANHLALLAGVIRDFIESYRVVASALPAIATTAMDRKEFVRYALDRGKADFLAGRIHCRESLSKPTLENAVDYFAERGLIDVPEEKGGKLALGKAGRDPSTLASALMEIDTFLS
jgi:glycerol-3-phosphate O-acyltransferase